MKSKLLLSSALVAAIIFSGCATHATSSGGRETTVLAGALTVATDSFQPTTPATVDADTSKIMSKGDPSGKKITLFWGLITLHDY